MNEDCVNIRCSDAVICVGAVQIIRGVSFDCCAGDWVVISGAALPPTPALLRMLRALCPQSPCRVWAMDTAASSGAAAAEDGQGWHRSGGFVQAPGMRAPGRSLRVASPAGIPARGPRAEVLAWLERTGLGDGAIGGGGRRGSAGYQAALTMAPLPRPQVLVLDKPTACMDSRSARIVMSAVRDLLAVGATAVIAYRRQDMIVGPGSSEIIVERRRLASICA